MKRTVKLKIMKEIYGTTRFDRGIYYGEREITALAKIYYPTKDGNIALFAVDQSMQLVDVSRFMIKAGYRHASLEEFEGKFSLDDRILLVALQPFRILGESSLADEILEITGRYDMGLYHKIFHWVSDSHVRFVGIKK